MKKLFAFLLLFTPLLPYAQSVGISNDNSVPHSSAILDIKSTTKGLLIPRMSTLERTSIIATIGLTVFDMDTYSYWMYRGDVMGGWVELQHSFQNYWLSNDGVNIFTKNSGNVGVGTNNPTEKFVINATNPVIQLMNAGTARGFFQVNGTDLKMGTYFNNTTGNLIFSTRATDRLWITPAGNIGIGTSVPSSLLTINGTDPVLQLRNSDVNKGFMQLTGNDIKIGTSNGNAAGKFVIRTNGTDRIFVNDDGWMGVNVLSPNSMLQVNGDGVAPTFRAQVSGNTKLLVAPNGGVSIGNNVPSPPSNGLYVAGPTAIGTTVPTADLTINNIVPNEFPNVDIKYNGVNFARLGLIQNAYVDLKLSLEDPYHRIILGGPGNQFGVMVHGDNEQTSISGWKRGTGYELSVNGQIICEDVTMQAIGAWPDYVFEKDYKLMPLTGVKEFIETNKHLPNIPSAAVIEKQGIQLKDMTMKLIEKVEELTLYILQQQEQINELKKNQSVQSTKQ
ncbi:MAG TPA: hypothetical protein VHM26_02370 [Chitinophagaceae bacterium]|jgi:hypothetical protein|nr:hypothetical protein [Chitinophagaceae bacterium]